MAFVPIKTGGSIPREKFWLEISEDRKADILVSSGEFSPLNQCLCLFLNETTPELTGLGLVTILIHNLTKSKKGRGRAELGWVLVFYRARNLSATKRLELLFSNGWAKNTHCRSVGSYLNKKQNLSSI